MTKNNIIETEPISPVCQQKQRKKQLTYFFLAILIIFIFWWFYWFSFIRNYESTDDAYVNGNQVFISSQLPGKVIKIYADDMDYVKAGDPLILLEDSDARNAFLQAQANLASVIRQFYQLTFNTRQLESLVKLKHITLKTAQQTLHRRETLKNIGGVATESLQNMQNNVASAKADLEATQHQLNAQRALLQQGELHHQPRFLQAQSQLYQAWLNLKRTQITSPIEGYIAKRSVQVGNHITQGRPLMSVVSRQNMWVDANFKETQLTDVRIGQPASVSFDLYGSNVTFNATVSGIELGTGSAFSILPAQNATGNWIKVTQRIPVRIQLDPQQIQQYPLFIGLSSHVRIDVSHKSGDVLMQQPPLKARFKIESNGYDEKEFNQLVEKIIQQNQVKP